MKIIKHSFLIILIASLLSCTGNPENKQTPISKEGWNELHEVSEKRPQEKTLEPQHHELDSIRKICNEYWDQKDSLHSMKVRYFEEYILLPLATDPKVPEVNKAFLRELLLSFQRPLEEDNMLYHRPLAAVFTLTSKSPIVVKYTDALLKEAVEQIPDSIREKTIQWDIPLPQLFSKIKIDFKRPFFAITQKGVTEIALNSYNYRYTECNEYLYFGVSNEALETSDQPLIMSPFKLDLEFLNAPGIDSLWRTQFKYHCYDCVFQYEPKSVFAKLKGVDDLYLTYSDNFPTSQGMNYPQRALMMKMGNRLVNLWVEEVDLFGCSCL